MTVLLAAVFTLNALGAFGGESVGQIMYLEGEQRIVRDDTVLVTEDIFIGVEVENFDFIHTGDDGLVEFQITLGKQGPIVKVLPDTQFYVEILKLGGKPVTTLGMLGGNIAAKVQKLTNDTPFRVKTDTLVMGVRGTSFTVSSPPGGEVLITCEEGEVECTDTEGRVLAAKPGAVVEQRPGEVLRAIPVAVSDIATFRENWYTLKIDAIKANALKATRDFAPRYNRLHDVFTEAFDALMRVETVEKWISEDKQGIVGSKISIMREKKAVIGLLLEIRRVLFVFERVYFRLLELSDYHEQGHGVGYVSPGTTTASFFADLAAESAVLDGKMRLVRYVVKLYVIRNDGTFPLDWSSAPSDVDFFGDDFEWSVGD